MKSPGKLKSLSKHTIFAIIAAAGVAAMLITLYFSTAASLSAAEKTMKRNIGDLKKQCNDFSDFLAADKVKSLVRLTEQAENISETLTMLNDNDKKKYPDEFCDSQRLEYVLILDANMMPDCLFVSSRTNYEEWADMFSGTEIRSVLTYPKKIYSAQITHGGQTYNIAAAARKDAKGVVFCAMLQEDEKLEAYYSPVRSLLAANETVLNGTLFITENDSIIACNRETAYKTASEIPELKALAVNRQSDSLVKINCGGNIFYGGSAKYRNYNIYAFYPAKEVFYNCRIVILTVFCLYIVVAATILTLYYRAKAFHNREMERQYEIIHSISHIYLLTVIVDMQNRHYKILKYPKEWGNICTSGAADSAFFERFISFVGEEFREGYAAFSDQATIRARLGATEYAGYDYQDIFGEWLNDQIIPQERDKNGNFNSYILVRKSIHEQKKAELEYQERLKSAVRNEMLANQSKTEFLRRMSHDVRTPINVILGMLEIGDRNPADTKLLENCRKKSKAAAEYLLELVNDILSINKMDAADAEGFESTEPFDLADEVQKMYLVIENLAKASGVTLKMAAFHGENRALAGNALHLRQIMMNIITNAVKYSRKGDTVCFSVSEMPAPNLKDSAEIRFVCEDNGIGMSKEFQKKMFERFARESDASSNGFGSVGLGLAIVHKLVKKLGGKITVVSEKGTGTRFEVILHYKYSGNPVEKETEKSDSISLKGMNVLLVEDNELNMEIAEYMLADAGANVVKAYNGKEAVDRFAASSPGFFDAVLTDITMPVMDGLEETRRIRGFDRCDATTVPIIAMTANLFEQDIKDCSDAGMTGFLAKPLNIGQLLETVLQQAQRSRDNE